MGEKFTSTSAYSCAVTMVTPVRKKLERRTTADHSVAPVHKGPFGSPSPHGHNCIPCRNRCCSVLRPLIIFTRERSATSSAVARSGVSLCRTTLDTRKRHPSAAVAVLSKYRHKSEVHLYIFHISFGAAAFHHSRKLMSAKFMHIPVGLVTHDVTRPN